MLLDVGDTIFIWLGNDSNHTERHLCLNSAKEYLETDPAGRDKDIPIVIVKQGYEPPHFIGFFGAWDCNMFSVNDLKMCSRFYYGQLRIKQIFTYKTPYFNEER